MEELSLKRLQELVMQQAKEKGWGIKPEEVNIGEKFALIFTEVAEAYEGYRHNNFKEEDGVEEGLGDTIQRVLHLCGILGIDIEAAIKRKLESNKTREWDWKNINEKRG